MEHTYTLKELPKIADAILQGVDNKTLLFYGQMGAGKTTLIKALAKKLGCDNPISSPTYSLVNEYQLEDDILYHFDFYRIKDVKEGLDMGVEEYFDSGYWNFIEWPEKVDELLPTNHTKLKITINQNGSRTLILEPVK